MRSEKLDFGADAEISVTYGNSQINGRPCAPGHHSIDTQKILYFLNLSSNYSNCNLLNTKIQYLKKIFLKYKSIKYTYINNLILSMSVTLEQMHLLAAEYDLARNELKRSLQAMRR